MWSHANFLSLYILTASLHTSYEGRPSILNTPLARHGKLCFRLLETVENL